MFQALNQIRDVIEDRAFIHDAAAHALRDLDFPFFREIPLAAALFKSFQRRHAAIPFLADAVFIKIFARSFLCSGEH